MTKKSKTKTVTIADDKTLAVLSDEERRITERFREKLSSNLPFKDGAPAARDGKPEVLSYSLLMETCKATRATGALQLVRNAATGQCWENKDTCLEVAFSQMVDLAPQTPLEAMLISQMVAVNSAIGRVMQSAMRPDQTFHGRAMNTNLATKLQRTFLKQVETLQKMRGRGQQTVRVEHVTVNAGGQAIVGSVEHKTGGGESGK